MDAFRKLSCEEFRYRSAKDSAQGACKQRYRNAAAKEQYTGRPYTDYRHISGIPAALVKLLGVEENANCGAGKLGKDDRRHGLLRESCTGTSRSQRRSVRTRTLLHFHRTELL